MNEKPLDGVAAPLLRAPRGSPDGAGDPWRAPLWRSLRPCGAAILFDLLPEGKELLTLGSNRRIQPTDLEPLNSHATKTLNQKIAKHAQLGRTFMSSTC